MVYSTSLTAKIVLLNFDISYNDRINILDHFYVINAEFFCGYASTIYFSINDWNFVHFSKLTFFWGKKIYLQKLKYDRCIELNRSRILSPNFNNVFKCIMLQLWDTCFSTTLFMYFKIFTHLSSISSATDEGCFASYVLEYKPNDKNICTF